MEGVLFVTAADGESRLGCFRAAPYPDDCALTVLHFHGNAEIVPDYVPVMANVLNSLGVNVFFVEYRGYGMSTGAPSLNGMLDDTECVFETLGVSARQVVAFGRSLGSLFAVEVAARHPDIGGLILESGIAEPLDPAITRVSAEDLGTSLDELTAAVAERVDQRAKLARYGGPLLVMHTAFDMLIPRAHGERLREWGSASTHDKTLVIFEQGDHGTIYAANQEKYQSELAGFFARVMASNEGARAKPA
jgi:pimeloyl-ACP methyl ester carboxylesterase